MLVWSALVGFVGRGQCGQGPVGCSILAWPAWQAGSGPIRQCLMGFVAFAIATRLGVWENMGNSRYNTGYRKYGRETPPIVFGPVPEHTYPGSHTVFSFSRKNENERFKTGIWYRTGRYFSCSFSSILIGPYYYHTKRSPHG
jgi:hypothetical protein